MEDKYYIKTKDYLITQKTFFIVKQKNTPYLITKPKPLKKNIQSYYESNEYDSHKKTATSLFDKVYHFSRDIMLVVKGRLIKKLFKKPLTTPPPRGPLWGPHFFGCFEVFNTDVPGHPD